MVPRTFVLVVMLFALALAATATLSCGLRSEEDSPSRLVIYSGRGESLVKPIVEQFAEATGINVSVNYGSTAEIAATLLEEGDNSPADVFFAQDPGGLGAVSSMLGRIPGETLELAPSWARSPEGKWVGVSGRARVVTYNTDSLTEADLPDSLWGFTDPKWKGRIGWPPTNASFQAMITGMRLTWGEERTREWLRGILANDPAIYPKNTPAVAATAAGEIEVAFVNHYYLHRFLAEEGENFGARNYHLPDGGPGSLVLVAGVGIIDGAENRENAESFVKFLLSTVAQQYFASQTYEYPLVEGIKTNRLLTPLEQINAPSVDMADLQDLAGTQSLLRELGVIQ